MAASTNSKHVRNFYLSAEVDGYQAKLEGGPRNADGGLYLNLYQRDKGTVESVLEVRCYVTSTGQLITEVSEHSNYIFVHQTQR